MSQGNPAFKPPVVKNPPDTRYNLYCYFCDWHMTDSNTARKRLGQHITDTHPEEMRFKKGEKPPEIEG